MMTKERILVVDDSPESVWPLVEYLEAEYRIVCATTPEKALALAFSEDRPDLILLDVVLPEMDGYQLFKKFKNDVYTRDIPIIFLTGLTGPLDEVKGLDIGAQDYIVKPYSLAVVGARIKSVLHLKKELERRSFLRNQMEEVNRQLERQVRGKMKELDEARETLQAYEEKYEYLFAVAPSLPQSRKVLVVDDTSENIHILLEALEKEYQVFYATSGWNALKIVDSPDRPDVVLLDIMMPEMDGYEVCSRLKADASTWDIPVIFITGLDQELDETKGLNLGAIDFIVKPFSLPVVKARVKSALRLKEEMDNRIVLTRKLEDLNRNLEKRVQEKTLALKQANEELLANERRYRTLYETAIEGIFEVTPDGRMLSASPSLARILGYESPQELMDSIDNAVEQLYVNPRDRARYVAELEEHGRIIDFETRFHRKQGDIIWVLICAQKNYSELGGGTTYQGFLIDISQRKKTQLKNRQHVRELRLLNKIIAASVSEGGVEGILGIACRELSQAFHLSHTMAFLFSKDQTLATVAAVQFSAFPQAAAREWLLPGTSLAFAEYPSARQLLTTSPLVFDDAQHDDRLTEVAGVLEEGDIHSLLVVPLMVEERSTGCLIMATSEPHSFLPDRVRLAQSVADQISGVIKRFQLDEKRRQLEKQYFQAQKMESIGTLTGGVAHDFNNILTVILGVSELMSRQMSPGDPLLPKLDQIHTAAERAVNLVRQLLAFSRQQILQPKRLNMNEVLTQFGKMIKRVIGEDIEFRTELAPDIGLAMVDQGQIEQVVMNLVVNARDAMPEGGQLIIETENVVLDADYCERHLEVRPGRYVMIAVSDTGTGIDKSILPCLFEPFFTTKAPGKGTGLGLSTVHGIVKQSGGHIWVYSEPGQGSCFKIYLPRLSEDGGDSGEEMSASAAPEALGGKEAILIVEDDESLRDIVSQALRHFGYTVWTADRASTAVEVFAAHDKTVDLLLTDVIMPGDENGVMLAKRLCAEQPRLKVLYMSGYTNSAIVNQGIVDLHGTFIQKPFLANDLARKIRSVLDRQK